MMETEFTFDYQVHQSKANLESARDYFASACGDSRSVFRVMDPEDGTIIGKGTASWMLMTNNCLTDYHIRLLRKIRHAFSLRSYGVPPLSQCTAALAH
jgi:hypothetical protein